MENKSNSAIPGAKPASTNNPRKVEKGSLMPQFGGGQSAADEKSSAKGVVDEKNPASGVVDEENLKLDGKDTGASAKSVAVNDKGTADDATPIPTEADGFGIGLEHLDTLFENQPGKEAKTGAGNAMGANRGNAASAIEAAKAANQPRQPSTPPTPSMSTLRPLDTHSPLNRPMQKAAPSVATLAKPKHKNVFMLVSGALAAVALLVTIGIVAALSSQASDPVVQAVNKILDGQASPNVEVHGTVNLTPKDKYAILTHYNMAVDVQLIPSSLINSVGVKLTVGGDNVSDQTFEFNEVYAANGSMYLKASGVVKAMENIDRDLTNATNGQVRFLEEEEADAQTNAGNQASEEGAETDEFSEQEFVDGDETVVADEFVPAASIWSLIPEDSFLTPLMQIAEDTDNTWIQVPMNGEELATDGLIQANSEDFTDLTCKVQLANKLRNNLSTVMRLYRSHPFISSTTDGVTLEAKNFPVRKIVIDQNNFISFANAANDAKLFDEYFRCASMNIRDLYAVPEQLPEILVEVSGEHDFTRVIWNNGIKDGTLEADLGLKYPSTTIIVQTPSEFMTWNQVLQREADFLNQYLEVEDTEVEDAGDGTVMDDTVIEDVGEDTAGGVVGDDGATGDNVAGDGAG